MKIVDTPRYSAQHSTFIRSTHKVQPHASPRNVLHHATSYGSTSRFLTTRQCRSRISSAHRFSSPSLTDSAHLHSPIQPTSAHLHSPIQVTSAHRFCSPPLTDSAHFRSRNLNQQPTNSHVSSIKLLRFHQRTLQFQHQTLKLFQVLLYFFSPCMYPVVHFNRIT